jgi:hypothetical protein
MRLPQAGNQFSASRYPSVKPGLRIYPPGPGAGNYNHRPAYPYRYRRPYFPFYGAAFPYGVGGGWLGADCLAYPYAYADCGYGYSGNDDYDDSGYANPDPQPSGPQPIEQASLPPDYYVAPPMDDAQAPPNDSYRPAYQRPAPEPEPQKAVTLIFKDGRPSQQFYNYMLTRTTLYVQDQHRQQIPVADIDLAATQKVNTDAGVEFQLPAGR